MKKKKSRISAFDNEKVENIDMDYRFLIDISNPAHALLKVRHFRDTQVVFSYKHTAEYQDLNFHFGHVKLFK